MSTSISFLFFIILSISVLKKIHKFFGINSNIVNKNKGNGIVVVRHKKYQIAWTGEIAQHIYDKNVDENYLQAVLFIEAQQCVSRRIILVLGEKHYFALLDINEYVFVTKFSIIND